MAGAADPLFLLHERGTSALRGVRGGVATFFAPAYIVVFNPLILGSGKVVYSHPLNTAQPTVATAVVAGVMTIPPSSASSPSAWSSAASAGCIR